MPESMKYQTGIRIIGVHPGHILQPSDPPGLPALSEATVA